MKVPAWAGRIAIVEDWREPKIEPWMLDCAVDSLLAEFAVFGKAKDLVLGDWETLIMKIVGLLGRAASIKSFTTVYGRQRDRDLSGMCKSYAAEWPRVKKLLVGLGVWKRLSEKDGFEVMLDRKLVQAGVVRISASASYKKWGSRSIVYQLVDDSSVVMKGFCGLELDKG